MIFDKIKVPDAGAKITVAAGGGLQVPVHPIIPYIEGDGIGVDITPAMHTVLNAAVAKAYGGERKIAWMEIYAGEKANRVYGQDVWLPDETLAAIKEYLVGIKGPLTTPIGGGIRSLNVALRQQLDLFTCQRPVRWFKGRSQSSPRAAQAECLHLPREFGRYLCRRGMASQYRGSRQIVTVSTRRDGCCQD